MHTVFETQVYYGYKEQYAVSSLEVSHRADALTKLLI